MATSEGASTTSGGASPSPQAASLADGQELPPPDVPNAQTQENEYRIGPLDQLEMTVFRVPELTGPLPVDANGEVAVPLIGSVAASGKTTQELETDIAAALGAQYLQSPQVSIAVKESLRQRITVEGAVKAPGIFPIQGRTTLLQAVALSEGLSETSNPTEVTVFRTVNTQRMAARFDLKDIRAGRSPDPEVHGGDIVVVGESATRARLRDLRGIVPLMGLFTPII